MHELNLQLMARGVEVAVLCSGEPGQAADNVRRDEYGGYRVYRTRRPDKAVEAVCRDFQPHAAVIQGGAMMALANSFHGAAVPAVVNFLDCEFKDGNLFVPGSPWLFIGNSPFTARRAETMLGIECHLLQSIIRPGDYVTETARSHALFVGNSPLKGLEIALRLARSRPNIPFIIVESWPMEDVTRNNYMARSAAAGNIEWSRTVADIKRLYARARLVLVPSVWNDSAPSVVAEAQASGIPVLASNIAGLPYMVGRGGRLVDVDAPHAEWLAAFDAMWNDAEEYAELSDLARQHAFRDEVAPGAIMDRFMELVTEYVAARGSGRTNGARN